MSRWLGIAIVIVILDQTSKYAVTQWLDGGRSVEVTSFFNFVLVYNSGAAFSFLASAAGWQRLFFIGIAVIASVWIVVMLRRHAGEVLLCLALSLILGGAIGNVIDRIWLGAVIDFLDFHLAGWHWPAFNVADSAITCGAVMVVVDSLRPRRAG